VTPAGQVPSGPAPIGPSREDAAALDAGDPLAAFRERFVVADAEPGDLPLIYLDGNSLGRLPAATPAAVDALVREQWGHGLVRSWHDWIEWPTRLGDRLAAHVLGARPGEVVVSDSTSVNLYKLAAAALDAAPGRGTVVVEAADFPTDRYVLQGLAEQRGLGLRALESDVDDGLTPEVLRAALGPDVALVVLSAVNYRSGALLDVAEITAVAAAAGARVLWDVSHAAGVVPLDLHASGAELAVGCTYKYLNAGPGAPAFLYVRRELQPRLRQPVWGWFGQRDQFLMADAYEPADGIGRFCVGTPPMLSLAAVGPALDLVAEAGIERLRRKSVRQGELLVELAERWLAPLGFRLASPRDPGRRGAHVSLEHPDAWRVCRALAAAGVVCDYRVPDRLRLGPSPIYTRFVDLWDAVDRLRRLVAAGEHEHLPRELPRVT
jgi:kynureninase